MDCEDDEVDQISEVPACVQLFYLFPSRDGHLLELPIAELGVGADRQACY